MRNLYEAAVRPKPAVIQASEVDRPIPTETSQSYFQLFKRNVVGFFSSGNNTEKEEAEDQPEIDPGAIVTVKEEQNREEVEKEKISKAVVAAAAKAVGTKSIKVGPDRPGNVVETKSCTTETEPSSEDENGLPPKVATPKTAKKPKRGLASREKTEPSSGDESSSMTATAKKTKKVKSSSSNETEEVERSSGDEKESPSKAAKPPVKPRVVKKAKSVESTSTSTAASLKSTEELPPLAKVKREIEKPLAVLFSDEHSESESDSFSSSSSSSEERRVPAKPSNLKKPPQKGSKRKGPKKRVRFKRKIKEVREFYS